MNPIMMNIDKANILIFSTRVILVIETDLLYTYTII